MNNKGTLTILAGVLLVQADLCKQKHENENVQYL